MAEMDALFLLYPLRKKAKYYKSKRRFWMHSIFKRREQLGEFHSLVKELSNHEDKFFQYFRVSQLQFNNYVARAYSTRHYEERTPHTEKYLCSRETCYIDLPIYTVTILLLQLMVTMIIAYYCRIISIMHFICLTQIIFNTLF